MAITRVGSAKNTAGGSFGASSGSVAYTATNGNTLLLMVATAGGTDTTVSDGVNTWTRDKTQTVTGGGRVSIYRASNITGGSLTITATVTGGSMNFGLIVVEYSGLAATTPTDGDASAAGNITTIDSGSIATTNADDLIFSCATTDAQTFTATGGVTAIDNVSQGGLFVNGVIGIAGEQIVSATGSYAGTYSIATSAEWGVVAVAYKADHVPVDIHAAAVLLGTGSISATPTVHHSVQNFFPDIFVFIAEPGQDFDVIPNARIYERGQNSYNMTVNQRGTSTWELYIASSSGYQPSIGAPVLIKFAPSSGVLIQLFAGTIDSFDIRYISEQGDRYIILNLVSLEQCFDTIRIPPRAYFGETCGAIVTDLFNTVCVGVPVTLGTISDGPRVTAQVYGEWQSVSDAFTALATIAGFQWYCDHSDSTLQFRAPTSDVNSRSLTTPDIFWGDPLDLKESRQNFRDGQIVQLAQLAASISGQVFPGDDVTESFDVNYLVDTVISASITASTQATQTGTFTGQPVAGETISISFVPITGTATHFVVSAPMSVNGATPFNFTVTAFDDGGNIITTYAGTVHFTASSPNSGGLDVLPGDSTLTSGTGTFSAKFQAGFTGGNTITATDTVDAAVNGTSGTIIVNPVP